MWDSKFFSKRIFGLAIIAVLVFSCQLNSINGSGNVTTEKRNIAGNFTSIKAEKGLDIVLEQAQETEVTVVADDNLQKHITTKVLDSVLVISSEYNSYRNVRMKKVIVKMPKVEAIKISSGAHFVSRNTIRSQDLNLAASSGGTLNINVEAEKTICETSSGSNITIKGHSNNLETASSSGSTLDGEKLMANNIIASASSGSNNNVYPLISLNANASSGGSINYYHVPKNLNKKSSSGGNVNSQ